LYFLDKFNTPSGTDCNQESLVNSQEIFKQYADELLNRIEKQMHRFSFLAAYKK